MIRCLCKVDLTHTELEHVAWLGLWPAIAEHLLINKDMLEAFNNLKQR